MQRNTKYVGSGGYQKKYVKKRKVGRPKKMVYYGHGDYKKAPAKSRGYSGGGAGLGATLGAGIGTAIAPGIGTAIGAGLGGMAGYGMDKIFGWGDYKIKSNTLYHNGQPALFNGKETVRIRHREYIADISSSVAFTNKEYPLNPGLASSFPWLSAVADQFEQYRINGMIYEFVSTSSDALASTNPALGSVILATDYDSADSAFENQQQMMSTMFSNSSKPSNNIMHAIECARNQTPMDWYFVRSGSVPSGKDERLYDLGKFQIATYGTQAGGVGVIGQLWVTYDVTFTKKQMNNVLGLSVKSDHFIMTAPTTSNYFGTTTEKVAGSSIGCTIDGADLLFPADLGAGTYLISYSVRGASTVVTSPVPTYTNCGNVDVYVNNTSNSLRSAGSTATFTLLEIIVKITAQGAKLTFAGGTLNTSPTYGDLWITQVNGNLD